MIKQINARPKKNKSSVIRAISLTSIYTLAGLTWITLSEMIVVDKESAAAFTINMLKGSLYVVLTSVLIFLVIYFSTRKLIISNERLKESENALLEAQRLAHIGSVKYDVKTGRLTCTDEIFNIFNVKPEEFSGDLAPFLERIHPDDRDLFTCLEENASTESGGAPHVCRILTADGEMRFVHIRYLPTCDRSGALVSITGTVLDITEPKMAEITLAEREARYRTFFDSSSDLVFLKDEQLRYIFVNKNMASFLGKPEDEVIGKTSPEVMPGDAPRNWHENEKAILASGKTIYLEEVYGETTYWGTAFPVHLGRAKTGVGGIVRDITERKQAEVHVKQERDRAEMYLEIATIIFLVVARDGTVSLINRTGCEILGYEKNEILGKPWIGNFIAESCRQNATQLLQKMESGNIEGFEVFECSIRNAQGGERSIVWRNAVLRDAWGAISGVLSSGIDVTEYKAMTDALKESERSKSVLLSNLPGLAYRCQFDRSWTMRFISDGCYALTGYQPEALINNSVISYNDIICEEYREKIWDVTSRNLALKLPMRYEYEITTACGSRKWVYEICQGVYSDQGEVDALEGIIVDIDESKKRSLKIQYMSDHDYLTGVYNRQYYESAKTRLDTRENLPLTIFQMDINGLKLINEAFGQKAGDDLIRKTGEIVKGCLSERHILARTEGDSLSILMPNTDQEAAYQTLLSLKQAIAAYNEALPDKTRMINLSFGYGVKTAEDRDIAQVEKDAEAYLIRRKLLTQKSHQSAMLNAITATMYERSYETEEHAKRIAFLCRRMGERMGLAQDKLDELSVFSMLHDIGKMGINDQILKKPGKLTEDEWSEMRKHPDIGYRIAMSSPALSTVAEYILDHHERWDGKGYPRGLSGEGIPLLSRILAVADAYDAMTQDRVYRKAMTWEEAVREIAQNAGTQFDPQIVGLFLEIEKG